VVTPAGNRAGGIERPDKIGSGFYGGRSSLLTIGTTTLTNAVSVRFKRPWRRQHPKFCRIFAAMARCAIDTNTSPDCVRPRAYHVAVTCMGNGRHVDRSITGLERRPSAAGKAVLGRIAGFAVALDRNAATKRFAPCAIPGVIPVSEIVSFQNGLGVRRRSRLPAAGSRNLARGKLRQRPPAGRRSGRTAL